MKEELKALIEKMNEEQFDWFIDQARRVLSEEAAWPARQRVYQ